jgi:apolipoprotein N-acyltransferase
MRARAYPPFWRLACALLVVVGRGSMLVLLVLLLFFETRLTNPLRLIRLFVLFCLVPELTAWLVGRAFEVALRIEAGALVIDQPRRRMEIPLDSIERVEAWALPVPGEGLWIRLKSGNRFHYGLELANAATLMDAMSGTREANAASGIRGKERLRAAPREPRTILALATGGGARRWDHLLLKFPIFALVPALPLFRLHQWITYGGTFGEYYQYGLEAYLLAFFIYWANATIWLVLYAAGLRALVAIGVVSFAFVVPSRAPAAVRAGEMVHRLLYYGGVVVFLVRLYLLSRV